MARYTPLNRQLATACVNARAVLLLSLVAIACCEPQAALGQVLDPGTVPSESIITEDVGSGEWIGTHCDVCDGPRCDGCAWPGFGWQFKSGPSFSLGDGHFAENSRVGYQFAFGIREPLLPSDRRFFVDYGGAYLSAFGQEAPFTVEGSIEGGILGRRTLEDFLDLSLSELSRASAQVALGWYFDVVDCDVCRSRFAARFGGRLSHVRGHFDEIPTDALRDEINNSIGAGESFVLEKDSPFRMTDTSPGIFGGVEMAIDRRVSRTVNVSFLIDSEFANDWVNLKGLAKKGLPTASFMFGINVSR